VLSYGLSESFNQSFCNGHGSKKKITVFGEFYMFDITLYCGVYSVVNLNCESSVPLIRIKFPFDTVYETEDCEFT